MPLAAKFQDNLMLKPKRPIFKNYGKTLYFCACFEYQLMSIKHKDDVTTMSKKHEKIIAGIIDFWTKKQEFSASMLERGISRSWGRSWPRFWGSWEGLGVVSGRLGPHLGHLGPHSGSKVPTQRQPHSTSKKILKTRVPETGVGGMGAWVWGCGKTHDSEKSIAKP